MAPMDTIEAGCLATSLTVKNNFFIKCCFFCLSTLCLQRFSSLLRTRQLVIGLIPYHLMLLVGMLNNSHLWQVLW